MTTCFPTNILFLTVIYTIRAMFVYQSYFLDSITLIITLRNSTFFLELVSRSIDPRIAHLDVFLVLSPLT
jgi:hypothetical protein